MNIDKINELLERYYNAQTTESEEEELKSFFLGEEVPQQFAAEKEMFLQMQSHTADADVPEDLEERLSKSIDRWNAQEQASRNRRIYRLRSIAGIAASALIALSFCWYLYEPAPARKDTCATPEEAYMEAQKALTLFSAALNKGMAHMETAQNATSRIEQNILKHLN